MRNICVNMIKLLVAFVLFSSLFYITIRYFHVEYENQKRYKEPEGRAVKVFHEVDHLLDRMYIFMQTGE